MFTKKNLSTYLNCGGGKGGGINGGGPNNVAKGGTGGGVNGNEEGFDAESEVDDGWFSRFAGEGLGNLGKMLGCICGNIGGTKTQKNLDVNKGY